MSVRMFDTPPCWGSILHMKLFGTALLAGMLNATTCNAVAQSTPEFTAWWTRLTSGGPAGPAIDGVAIEYRVDHLLTPPSHETYRLWRTGSSWRWSRDNEDNAHTFWDMTWANGLAWTLSPDALTAADQATADATNLHIEGANSATSCDVQLLFTAGIATALASGIHLDPTLGNDNKWHAEGTAQRGDGASIRFVVSGHWQPTEALGSVVHSEFSLSRDGKLVGTSIVDATDWVPIPQLKLAIARSVLWKESGLDRRITLVSHSAYSSSEFKRLTAVPSITEDDPIRGRPTFRSVTDFRGGRPRVSEVDSQNRTKLAPMMPDRQEASNNTLRTLGWVSAAGLVAAIVLLRIRSYRHPSASR